MGPPHKFLFVVDIVPGRIATISFKRRQTYYTNINPVVEFSWNLSSFKENFPFFTTDELLDTFVDAIIA